VKGRKSMKIRKYGCTLMIVSLILFALFLSVDKNEHKDRSEEMTLRAGKETANIGLGNLGRQEKLESIESDAIAGQKVSENAEAVIVYDHILSGNMWLYYPAEEIPFVDEEYKQKFWSLLQNEVPFLDRETGKEIYIKDWTDSIGMTMVQDIKSYRVRYYFFDMNGDSLPELCIDNCVETTVFAYDPDTDQCITWTWLNGKDIVGTRKVVWYPEYDIEICEFFQMDPYGDFELDTLFWAEHADLYHYDINMVMFPNYADREKRWEITEEMKQQGVLEESSGQWFFRITDEQFEELKKPYVEALRLAREKKREVVYTYEELFGEYETE